MTARQLGESGTERTHEIDHLEPWSLPSEERATDRPLLQLAGISKSFSNDIVALEGVDLSVWPGEFVTLLGPSGCGKSTLLRLIAELTSPSNGQFDWARSDYGGYGKPNRSLGFVFQEPTLLPWRTVANNVYLPMQLAGKRKGEAHERIMEVLAQVGLSRFVDAYPRELSGGMKMRVSIARALLSNPRILLMDEPFAALDEITRTKLNSDLLELFARKHLTVIFVTHSVYESVFLSSRIVMMSARPGRVSAEIAIDVPYPRGEDYRMSPTYNEFCRQVSGALRRAMAENQIDSN